MVFLQIANLIPDIPKKQQILQFVAEKSKINLVNSAMPTQDAIYLAIFLADTQKFFARFSSGLNTVGGELDVATVTKHEGFKWINRKHYYSRDLNPLETDHVQYPHPPPDDPNHDHGFELPPVIWSRIPEAQTGQSVKSNPKITEEEKKIFLEAVRRALEL